jgi:hypothetical protein
MPPPPPPEVAARRAAAQASAATVQPAAPMARRPPPIPGRPASRPPAQVVATPPAQVPQAGPPYAGRYDVGPGRPPGPHALSSAMRTQEEYVYGIWESVSGRSIAAAPEATQEAFCRLAWILTMLQVVADRWIANPRDPRLDQAAEMAPAAISKVQDLVYHAAAGDPATAVRLAEEAAEPVESLRAAIFDDWQRQREADRHA